jgi:hypothetical protein
VPILFQIFTENLEVIGSENLFKYMTKRDWKLILTCHDVFFFFWDNEK